MTKKPLTVKRVHQAKLGTELELRMCAPFFGAMAGSLSYVLVDQYGCVHSSNVLTAGGYRNFIQQLLLHFFFKSSGRWVADTDRHDTDPTRRAIIALDNNSIVVRLRPA